MENLNEKASAYFDQNPSCKEVYATNDGYLFEKKADATDHALSLDAEAPNVKRFESKKNKSPEVGEIQQDTELVKTYFELFENEPSKDLSNTDLQELIDAKLAE